MEIDLGFLNDDSTEIKRYLTAFMGVYQAFTDEQKQATKKWLDDLAFLQSKAPDCFHPRVVVSKHFATDDEGALLPWSFPADFLVKAIRAIEQKNKYEISIHDLLDWRTY